MVAGRGMPQGAPATEPGVQPDSSAPPTLTCAMWSLDALCPHAVRSRADAQRLGGRGVPEPGLHDLDALVVPDQQRGVVVPQVVEGDRGREAGSGPRRLTRRTVGLRLGRSTGEAGARNAYLAAASRAFRSHEPRPTKGKSRAAVATTAATCTADRTSQSRVERCPGRRSVISRGTTPTHCGCA